MSCLKTVQVKAWKRYRFLTDNHISETSYRKLCWKFYTGRFPAYYLYIFALFKNYPAWASENLGIYQDNVDNNTDKMISSDFVYALGIQIPWIDFCSVISIFLIICCHHKILYYCMLFRHQSPRKFAAWPPVSECFYLHL